MFGNFNFDFLRGIGASAKNVIFTRRIQSYLTWTRAGDVGGGGLLKCLEGRSNAVNKYFDFFSLLAVNSTLRVA